MNRSTHPIIFSSKVPFVMRRYTFTTFFWPILWARSMAWRSFIGFQSCSTKITVSAPVKVNPNPPTWVVSNKQSMLGSALNVWTMACRLLASIPPSSRIYETKGIWALNKSVSMMFNICFIWQKMRTLCCENDPLLSVPVSINSLFWDSALTLVAEPMPQSSKICLCQR